MHAWIAVSALGAGLVGGLLSGLFGIGGGIVLVPLLALLLGLDQHQAQGVTLAALLLPVGLPAVLQYRRQGVAIHWPIVGLLMGGFLPGALGGASLANLVPAAPLRWGFSLFLALLSLHTFRRTLRKGGDTLPLGAPGSLRRGILAPALLIGAAGGMASGLLGIGGGIIMIPLLVGILGLTQHEAQAASLALMLPPIGLPAVLVYVGAHPGFPWAALGGVAAGFLGGAFLGAGVAPGIRGVRMTRAFALLVMVMAGLLLLRSSTG